MPMMLTTRNTVFHPLDATASTAALRRAVESRAQATLQIREHAIDWMARATLIGADASALHLELLHAETGFPLDRPDGLMHVLLNDGAAQYEFETRIVRVTPSPHHEVIHLRKPATISVHERRRSRRRLLRATTTVELRHSGLGESIRMNGTLLNLSVGGVACRLSNSESTSLHVHELVHLKFSIGNPPTEIQRTARVVSLSQGSSAGQTIVGLEFHGDVSNEMNDQRLRKLLATAND
ncbi:MAG: PilZ domain-containing protein [Planctomycetes bacterium]|nr:PilZ domain-containing protein [Planctomycetota bacterium]